MLKGFSSMNKCSFFRAIMVAAGLMTAAALATNGASTRAALACAK